MKKKHLIAAAVGSVVVAGTLAACGSNMRMFEQYQDADVAERNEKPADIITMPDGFANVATKCDHGFRIYVSRDADGGPRGSVAVIDDPSCKG